MHKRSNDKHRPPVRKLRGFSFDPSLSAKRDTAEINQRVYQVPWEDLEPGPVGEYIEIVDFDPASNHWYEPVDLDHPHLLAQDGLPPLSSNPQFHQQMVYAVVMTTIKNFERALGRPVMWSDRKPEDMGKKLSDFRSIEKRTQLFVEKLRVYPHAMREANAYYSPSKKALLFGYFPTAEAGNDAVYPGGIVFGCLSHDIVAHETAHAILDGIYPRFMEVTQPDGLAFHEAFADIVALFQHFTFGEVVRSQIARTKGNLEMNNLLGELAQEFGRATGNHGSLRDALGEVNEHGNWKRKSPDPHRMETDFEPHSRGSILVAAVFDAFVAIYKSRIADLQRIASGGTGILQEGELHPDLVNRLAAEAVTAAKHVLTMCIRALDYCPPVDISFGDYLRALITADRDVVPDDECGYRLAFVDAFRSHGIFPRGLRTLSEESLAWDSTAEVMADYQEIAELGKKLKPFFSNVGWHENRRDRWLETLKQRAKLHEHLQDQFWTKDVDVGLQKNTGLDFSLRKRDGTVEFELHSLWPLQRQRPDGSVLNQVIFSILQYKPLGREKKFKGMNIWGGCTFIVDLDSQEMRFMVRKPLYKQDQPDGRITRAKTVLDHSATSSLAATYGLENDSEPFAMLHTCD